ncbi:hypothetical protein [Streptomyces sp. NPDC058701]|uniref:hypothetical protein n=1 Tax=Streptomyces sp. NPDC058701 TaxID=3346608 RepID=UPI0036492FAF
MMENMPKKKSRPGRQFTADFETEIGEMCLRSDRSVPQVVKDFDLAQTPSGRSRRRLTKTTGPKTSSVTRAELAGLRGRTAACGRTSRS